MILSPEANQNRKIDPFISVSKPEVKTKLGETEVSFLIKHKGELQKVWFRSKNLPEADYTNVALATTLLPAMKMNQPLQLEGTVSPKLLNGIAKIQEIFNCWDKSFHQIEVKPNTVQPANYGTNKGGGSLLFLRGS